MAESAISAERYQLFLNALLAGDKASCRRQVQELLSTKISALDLYTQLFSNSLYEVGHRWEAGLVSVAQEHLASLIIEDLMGLVFAQTSLPARLRRRAIVFCGADELHQIGGRMVADSLEALGWDAAFLGANTPTKDLVQMVENRNPELVAVSVTLEKNLEKAVETLQALRQIGPDLILLAGGQAVQRNLERFSQYPGLNVLCSLNELIERYQP